MADRMIVMHEGVAEQIGTPLEVYETPHTLFAAQFIGSPAMNIFDARIEDGAIRLGDATLAKTKLAPAPIKLGIRPEHLVPDTKGPLQAVLQIAEPLGANTLLHGQLSDSHAPLTVSLPGVHQIDAGTGAMRFSVHPDHLHQFDAATGQRVQS